MINRLSAEQTKLINQFNFLNLLAKGKKIQFYNDF